MTWEERLAYGHEVQTFVEEVLLACGIAIVSTADIQSERHRAPSLESGQGAYVLPDLQIFGPGISGWLEVKGKSQATKYRKTDTWEHGVEVRLWDNYLRVAAATGMECWLCVVELGSSVPDTPPRLLLQRCSVLDQHKRLYDGPNMPNGGRPHYFFPVPAFRAYLAPDGVSSTPPAPTPPQAQRSQEDGARPPQLGFNWDLSLDSLKSG